MDAKTIFGLLPTTRYADQAEPLGKGDAGVVEDPFSGQDIRATGGDVLTPSRSERVEPAPQALGHLQVWFPTRLFMLPTE
jgi:hypothetical protein